MLSFVAVVIAVVIVVVMVAVVVPDTTKQHEKC